MIGVRPEVTASHSKLRNRRGQELHCHYWQDQASNPKCLVIISHGFSEHLGIYRELAEILGTLSVG